MLNIYDTTQTKNLKENTLLPNKDVAKPRPRKKFGAGMFGYRRTGDLPPSFQRSVVQTEVQSSGKSTGSLYRPDLHSSRVHDSVKVPDSQVSHVPQVPRSPQDVFSPIFGIRMPELTDNGNAKLTEHEQKKPTSSEILDKLMTDTSVRGRFLINPDRTSINNVVVGSVMQQNIAVMSPPDASLSANTVQDLYNSRDNVNSLAASEPVVNTMSYPRSNTETNTDRSVSNPYLSNQPSQPSHFVPTHHTPQPSENSATAQSEIDQFTDSLLSLLTNEITGSASPIVSSSASYIENNIPMEPQVHAGTYMIQEPEPHFVAEETLLKSPLQPTTGGHTVDKLSTLSGNTAAWDPIPEPVSKATLLSELSSTVGQFPATNIQNDENIASLPILDNGSVKGHNAQVTQADTTYIQTIANLIESVPTSDLATIVSTMKLSTNADTGLTANDSAYAVPLGSYVSKTPDMLLASSAVEPVPTAAVNVLLHQEQQTASETIANQTDINQELTDVLNAIFDSTFISANTVDSSLEPTPNKSADLNAAAIPTNVNSVSDSKNASTDSAAKIKIGNIKVNSAKRVNNLKDSSKQETVIANPEFSLADFGVVMHEPAAQLGGAAVDPDPVPASDLPAPGADAILDDLLLGLRQLLDPDLTTVAPTTTTTAAPCTHESPTFKCTGKGVFKTLGTVGTWCLDMCKSSGCVDSACECGCDKPKPQTTPKPQVNISPNKWKKRRLKINNQKQGIRKQTTLKKGQRKPQRKPVKWSKPKKAMHIRQPPRRKFKKPTTRKPRWEKPKPTTEEPPEIEWEDILTTTTQAPPTTTDDVFYDLPATISPFEDIKLRQVKEKNVRAEKIHLTEIPQVLWASEIKSRFKKLAKNAIKASKEKDWKTDHVEITTPFPEHTTFWDMYTTTTMAPPTKEWGRRQWPKARPPDTWPADRWADKPTKPRDNWGSPRYAPPARESWGNSNPRYDPPPTYQPNQWNDRGGWGNNQWSNRWDSNQGGNQRYNGWGNTNHGLRNGWGNNSGNQSGGGEAQEAPDK